MECSIGDLTVYYEEFGEGRPLLLLHGWASTTSIWWLRWSLSLRAAPAGGVSTRICPAAADTGTAVDIWSGPDPAGGAGPDRARAARQRFAVGGVSAGAYLARGVTHHKAEWLDGLLLTAPVVVPATRQRDRPAAKFWCRTKRSWRGWSLRCADAAGGRGAKPRAAASAEGRLRLCRARADRGFPWLLSGRTRPAMASPSTWTRPQSRSRPLR